MLQSLKSKILGWKFVGNGLWSNLTVRLLYPRPRRLGVMPWKKDAKDSTVPLIEFNLTSKYQRLERRLMHSGNVSEIEFLNKERNQREERLQIESGIDHSKEFSINEITPRLFKLDIVGGMCPTKLFASRCNASNLERFELLRSRTEIEVRFASLTVIRDVKGLESSHSTERIPEVNSNNMELNQNKKFHASCNNFDHAKKTADSMGL
ncbi:hypothetical protein GH714_025443 [Hevea brasiliensis]|uniref:Uncharacterized protein n=1 Tax=Hevea brasiliensis TaxID=3981 RepID=A0A6A6MKS1_HEVBR|nr:hypothetical protein GH714_025443 [Hevea brasiliensis]